MGADRPSTLSLRPSGLQMRALVSVAAIGSGDCFDVDLGGAGDRLLVAYSVEKLASRFLCNDFGGLKPSPCRFARSERVLEGRHSRQCRTSPLQASFSTE